MKKPSNSPNYHYDSKFGWYYVRDIGDRKIKCKWPGHGFRSYFEGGRPKFEWCINGEHVQSRDVYQLIGENRSTQWWRCNPGEVREVKVRGKTCSIRAIPVQSDLNEIGVYDYGGNKTIGLLVEKGTFTKEEFLETVRVVNRQIKRKAK